MDIEKYKIKSVCKLKKGLIMLSTQNVKFVDQNGRTGSISSTQVKSLQNDGFVVFDPKTNTYYHKDSDKGVKLQKENEDRIQTTRTTSFNSANLTAEEKRYLQEQGLIKSFSDNGCELGLPNNASDDDIQARMDKIKTALGTYNKEHPTEPTRTEKTFTQEELAKVPEDQRKLLSGKITEETTGKKYDFEVTTTETTTEKYDGIPTKEDLAKMDLNDRSTRKSLEKNYKAALEQWIDASDAHKEDMKLSIAREKYSKQINKELNRLNKEYDVTKHPESFVKAYFEEGRLGEVSKEAKENYNSCVQIMNDVIKDYDKDTVNALELAVKKGEAEEATDADRSEAFKAQKGLELYDSLNNYLQDKHLSIDQIRSNSEVRNSFIRKFYGETTGANLLDSILERKAVDNVMDNRSAEQKVQDREDYLKYMSKREAQKYRDEQNINNTQLFLSKEAAKAAEKQNKAWKKAGDSRYNPKARFNFVEKAGLQMIENRPDYFCKPVAGDPSSLVKGKDYDYVVDGNCYKFDSKFYSDRIGEFFDNGGNNHHVTLSEIREFAGEKGNAMFSKDGKLLAYEGAFSKGKKDDDTVNYRDSKAIRKSTDATGRSSDKDHTNLIRFKYMAGKAGVGAITSAVTAGVAAWAGGIISDTVQGATQVFTKDGQTVHVDGERKWVKSVVTVNGRDYTINTPVDIDAKDVTGDKQTFTEDGQKVGYRNRVNPLEVGLYAAPLGALAAIPGAYKKALSKRDTGHTDDVVDLYVKPKTITKTRPDSLDFSHTTYKRTLVNAGDGNLQSLYEGENDVDAGLLKGLALNNPKARLVDTKLFERNETDVNMSDETQVKDVDKLRAQATISHRKDRKTAVHVEPKVVNGVRNFDEPQKITIEDETNDKRHTWTLEYRDRQATIEKYAKQAKKLAQTNENQAFYERTGIVANGRSIVDPDNHVEIYSMGVKATPKKVPVATPLGTLYVEVITYEYNGEQNANHIGVGANHTGIANKNAKSKLIRNSRQY